MELCKVCDHGLNRVMSFGQMPISNRFISDTETEEFLYELLLGFCPRCLMVQLENCVDPNMMFNAGYAYFSSISKAMEAHFEEMANEITGLVSGEVRPFVVELGCNDGIMLKHIAEKGIPHLGIEPSENVATSAKAKGVNVLGEFFNSKSASEIVDAYGEADVICGANVMCHIEDINSVFEGISILLKPEGVFFFEDPYLLDIVEKASFDQIYDEHIYYFSGLSISNLAKRHGLKLVDMVPQEVHGGSMRYYLKKRAECTVSGNVGRYLSREKTWKLHTTKGYILFRDRVDKICSDFKNTLLDIKAEGKRIAAYGATSKSTTLLNYAGVGPDLIEYVSDTTPTKIGKYTPGTHIPVKPYDYFVDDQPPYTVLLAWNHKREIFAKERQYRENGGKFITFFPDVIIE